MLTHPNLPTTRWCLRGSRLIVATLLLLIGTSSAQEPRALPEFSATLPNDWFNSQPLTLNDLQGRPALIYLWAYSCHNCYRSIPWLHEVRQRFDADALLMVGVHTPEFRHERDRRNVARKIKQYAIDHPIMLDNEMVYWRKIKNRYWPTFYLVDAQGQIRGRYIGETHSGDRRAEQIVGQLEKLIAASRSAD